MSPANITLRWHGVPSSSFKCPLSAMVLSSVKNCLHLSFTSFSDPNERRQGVHSHFDCEFEFPVACCDGSRRSTILNPAITIPSPCPYPRTPSQVKHASVGSSAVKGAVSFPEHSIDFRKLFVPRQGPHIHVAPPISKRASGALLRHCIQSLL